MTTTWLICGGRDFGDEVLFADTMRDILRDRDDGGVLRIIHGGAPGADAMAREWGRIVLGEEHVVAYPADWKKHGRAAGPIRNQRMIDEGKPDLVIAFPGGRGTDDMVQRSKAAGIEVIEVSPS